jgi:hypothetical protein
MQRRKIEKKKVSPPVLISRHCARAKPHSVTPLRPENKSRPPSLAEIQQTRARGARDRLQGDDATPTGRQVWGIAWGKLGERAKNPAISRQ